MGVTNQKVGAFLLLASTNAFSQLGVYKTSRLILARHIHPEQIQWLTYHGYKRHELDKSLDKYDAVLTTYDMLNAEGEESSLLNHEWQRIILDEGLCSSWACPLHPL